MGLGLGFGRSWSWVPKILGGGGGAYKCIFPMLQKSLEMPYPRSWGGPPQDLGLGLGLGLGGPPQDPRSWGGPPQDPRPITVVGVKVFLGKTLQQKHLTPVGCFCRSVISEERFDKNTSHPWGVFVEALFLKNASTKTLHTRGVFLSKCSSGKYGQQKDPTGVKCFSRTKTPSQKDPSTDFRNSRTVPDSPESDSQIVRPRPRPRP